MLVMGHVSGCSIRKELLSFSVDVEGGFVEGGFIRHPPEVPMHWPECLWQRKSSGQGPGPWLPATAGAVLALSTAAPLTWQWLHP